MREEINPHRRRFLGKAAIAMAAVELGAFDSADAQLAKPDALNTGPTKPGAEADAITTTSSTRAATSRHGSTRSFSVKRSAFRSDRFAKRSEQLCSGLSVILSFEHSFATA